MTLSKPRRLSLKKAEKIKKRSLLMASIRSKNTKFEVLIFKALEEKDLRFKTHFSDLPGKPDIALPKRKKVIFLDSDFWHGWRYPSWRNRKLTPFWKAKIEANIKRDRKNTRLLRKTGWEVLRVWEHQLKKDFEGSINKIVTFSKK